MVVTALLENIRIGWKELPSTNTLAYYEIKGRKKVSSKVLKRRHDTEPNDTEHNDT
jgi:hypothetical protein